MSTMTYLNNAMAYLVRAITHLYGVVTNRINASLKVEPRSELFYLMD